MKNKQTNRDTKIQSQSESEGAVGVKRAKGCCHPRPANLQTKSHLISRRSSAAPPPSTLMYQTALSSQQRASRPHMERPLISASQRVILLCKILIRTYVQGPEGSQYCDIKVLRVMFCDPCSTVFKEIWDSLSQEPSKPERE